jgi:hypothetical protein
VVERDIVGERKKDGMRGSTSPLSAHEAEYGGVLGILLPSFSHLCHASYGSLIIQPEPEQNEIHTIIDLLDIRTEGRLLVMDLRRPSYVLRLRKSVDAGFNLRVPYA